MGDSRKEMLEKFGLTMPDMGPEGPPAMGPVAPAVADAVSVASDRASRFRDAVVGSLNPSLLTTPDPERAALYNAFNPVAVAGARALGQSVASDMDPGIAKRGLEYLTGAPRPREMTSFTRTHESEPSDLKPMYTPDVQVQPAPTLASQGFPARGQGGGGGAGFGGLERNLRDAQGRQLKGYDDARDLEHELGIDKGLQAQGMSERYNDTAARMQRDADDQRRIDEIATQKHETFLARQEQLANDLAKQKVDPGRLLRSADAATQMTIGLGAALGGVFGNGHNDYLDRLDKLVDRDINAQIQDIDSKKSSFNARQSLFGQMLAETGDRRLAAMQTRKLIYDGLELKAKADSERLGIPIMRDNAAILGQAWAQKRADLETQIAATALQQQRAAAAAAVAAQRAAEERQWQHTKDMIELQLKGREIDAKILAAGGEGGKADAQALAETTKRLADDDIIKNRSLILSLKSKIRPDGTVIGLDGTATAKRAAAGMLPGVGLSPSLTNRIALSDDESISRQEYEQLKLLYQTKVTGSGGSDEQMQRIAKAFEGDGSSANKVRAIRMAVADLERREGLAEGNLTDSQKAELMRRKVRDGVADATIKPKEAK